MTHFYHKNVLEYDQRPFRDMGDMLDQMITKWNAVVRPTDTVYHLGDVAMVHGGKQVYVEYVKELNGYLNGRKVLIRGNHDHRASIMTEAGFSSVHENLTKESPYGVLYLVHKPYAHITKSVEQAIQVGPKPLVQPEADIVLHGHIHTRGWKALRQNNRLYVNVGCMRWGYQPRTLEELLAGSVEELQQLSEV